MNDTFTNPPADSQLTTTTAPRLRAAIVGLGKIGFSLDSKRSDRSVLTHAKSFATHPEFELVGAVDASSDACKEFEKAYALPAYSQLKDLGKSLDVISVAVPTEEHFSTLQKVLDLNPRLVILEKPMGQSLEEAEAMVKMAERRGVNLLVNFVRRFEPGVQQVREIIRSQKLGNVYKAVVWYSKGLHHNGSHLLDLCQFWFGEPTSIQIIERNEMRRTSTDIEPDFVLRYPKMQIHFLAAREESFSVRHIEVMGTQGSIRYEQGGERIDWYPVEASTLFDGYRFLSKLPREIPNDFARYQYHVADAAARHLREGTPLVSNARTALETLRLVERIHALCQNA